MKAATQEKYPSQKNGRSKHWKSAGIALHLEEFDKLDEIAQREGISRYALLQRFVRNGIAEAEKRLLV